MDLTSDRSSDDVAGAVRLPVCALGGGEDLVAAEWVLTNGIGGFAMGTAAGVPGRRYHGWLVASLSPPVRRVVALNGVVDRLVVVSPQGGERSTELSTFRFVTDDPAHVAAGVLHPGGVRALVGFERRADGSVVWTYRDGAVEVRRMLHLFRGRNAAAVGYEVSGLGPGETWRIEARPLTGLRDFHHLLPHGRDGEIALEASADRVVLRRPGWESGPRLTVLARGGAFRVDAAWWRRFRYDLELERGLDGVEDLFSPGVFVLDGSRGSGAWLLAAVDEDPEALPFVEADRAARGERLRGMIAAAAGAARGAGGEALDGIARLAAAADDFLVARVDPVAWREGRRVGSLAPATIIAGYPWFADWGRDAMISLPGLCLATGRFGEALAILCTFAEHQRDGLIPNRFDDDAGEPHYNTADASLWFLHAACEYARVTGDRAGFNAHLRGACLAVVEHYRRGTRVPESDWGGVIRMDPEDGLIVAGSPRTQLTWMDAKRDGVIFTPRHGKPVELAALWYHGLLSLASVLGEWGDRGAAADLRSLAEMVGVSLRRRFFLPELGYCADRLAPAEGGGGWTPVAEIRPNQIFAASLAHSALTPEQRRAVISVVRDRLATPHGLRTLDPADPGYHGRFTGDLPARDAAYHTGTAWPWLLPSLAEAQLRVEGFSPQSRAAARAMLGPLVRWIGREGCGQLPEVFDGDDAPEAPQRPGGCPAQAWSVAETLRVLLLAESGV